MTCPSRIGSWIQFEKIDGDGPDEGWPKYYGQGKRLAKRTAANDIAIMQSNFGIVPNEAQGNPGMVHVSLAGYQWMLVP